MTFTASSFRPLTAMAVVLMMGVAPAAFAQEAATPAAPAATPAAEAPAQAAPAAPATAAEAPATAESAAKDGMGEPYVKANFDAWEQRCVRTPDGADPCQLYQLLKDKDGNAVAEFSMFNLPDGGQAVAGATVVVPLETLLTENLVLTVDTAKPRVYPFTFCAPMGCVARVGFTAAEVDQFKKGAKASVSIVPMVAPDQKVTVDVSLKGFTAGYTAVAEANK